MTNSPTTASAPSFLAPDPELEPGFPVKSFETSGSYHAGVSIHTLVGNIDADPQLEILVTSLASGPLNAWKSTGAVVAGWPVPGTGAAYPAIGEFSSAFPGNEVFVVHNHNPGGLRIVAGDGTLLPGWPRNGANFMETPPTLADVDGDGIDEVFVGEEDNRLHGYRADGSILQGWPVFDLYAGGSRHTPAVTDLDGDGGLDILTMSGTNGMGSHLLAYHHDGSTVPGFPVFMQGTYTDVFAIVGDVDGDGEEEIVTLSVWGTGQTMAIRILSRTGSLERSILAPTGVNWGSLPALADLDGDAVPEIILEGNGVLYVWKGDGTPFPGWPQVFGPFTDLGNSAPVVGDLTGDCHPEIAVTTQLSTTGNGEIRVYDRNGNLHPSFPKVLRIESGAVPAIADFDLDGRNELIVSGSYWSGSSGWYDKVWAYDLGGPTHGPILWGQFMADARHRGRYRGGNLTPCAGFVPAGLTVDAASGPSSDGNAVLEPGEVVAVSPSWRSISTVPLALSSRSYLFTGPVETGSIYVRADSTADYGVVGPGVTADCALTTANCLSIAVSPPVAPRPTHWDARLEESLSTGATVEWPVHLGDSFGDVPRSSPFYRFVETLLHQGVTSGCSTDRYCPQLATTREQMAVFVLVSKEGGSYLPPACATAAFNDVPVSSPFCRWIEELARRGVVSGCGGGSYCPLAPVSREQMTVFLTGTFALRLYGAP